MPRKMNHRPCKNNQALVVTNPAEKMGESFHQTSLVDSLFGRNIIQ
jgi:hypothetical protein